MKIFIISILLVLLADAFGNESVPQDEIDLAYEAYRRKPIAEEEMRQLRSLSASDIFDQVLKADQSPSMWKESRLRILETRKDDLMLEIRKTLNQSQLTIDTLGKLTFMASLVSPDFEAEVASGILEHSSSPEFDTYFVESGEFRNHFRANPGLMQSSFDHLLAEGRIEMGSEIYRRWKDSIYKFERLQKNREKRESGIQRSGRKNAVGYQEKTELEEKEKSPFFGSFIFGGLIFLVILAALLKTWKANT